MRKFLLILLRIIVTFLLLFILFKWIKIKPKEVLGAIRNASIYPLLLSFFCFLLMYLLGILRWRMLLRASEVNASFWQISRAFMGGIFFNLFFPSTVGGDVIRSVDLVNQTKKGAAVVATVLLDRISGFAGLVVVATVASIIGYPYLNDPWIFSSLSVLFLLLGFILICLFNKKVFEKINRLLNILRFKKMKERLQSLYRVMHSYRALPRVLRYNFVISVIIQSGGPIVCYLIVRALGMRIGIIPFFILIPVIAAISSLPISIGGLGLRDTSTVFFLVRLGIPKEFGISVSLLWFAFMVFSGIIGGIVYILTLQRVSKNTQN